ncbi:MAG: DUF1476 domain-containing protein [Hyphomicrobiales bacterium]|nr:DUF1476 domain-containing protein [Hyphomicrobiales bacterium]
MTDRFREIEQSHEAKYKLDEELEFKAQCRRNRLLGQWAGQHMGLTAPQTDQYARALVRFSLDVPGNDQIVDKIAEDLGARGVKLGTRDVTAAFEKFQNLAREQIAQDYPFPLDSDHVQIGG